MQYLVGTGGWSYKDWEGNFYEKCSSQRKLRSYCRIFETAEIDSTFYRNPSKATVMGWLKSSLADFLFTAKLPKIIMHDKALGLRKDVKADLEEFLNLMLPLQQGGKLACLLIQLPPKYTYKSKNLEAFFQMLDPRFRFAVEFRNVTWLLPETITFKLLKQYNVAYTIVDDRFYRLKFISQQILPISVGMGTAQTYGLTTNIANKNLNSLGA